MVELPPVLQLKGLTPSLEQRPAVLNRGEDVVVTAGAGAGKTRTLVGRYVSLLADGYPLRSIVAITFTRKAAREMRIRVREVVRSFQTQGHLDETTRRYWQNLYLSLDSARIGTIHSLCAEILRAHPAEMGVDPQFIVLDEAESHLLQQQALTMGMALAANQEGLTELYSVFGERKLVEFLESLLAQRLDAEKAFASKKDQIVTGSLAGEWKEHISQVNEQALTQLVHSPDWLQAQEILTTEYATDPTDRIEIQRCQVVEVLLIFAESQDAMGLQALDRINLLGGRGATWPKGTRQRDDVKHALSILRKLWRKRSPAILRSYNELDAVLVRTLPQLYQVFNAVLEHYTVLKEQQNALDFDDLESYTVFLLDTNTEVRASWQREFQAILVDEFQDTNARQRDLLDLLNGDAHKLFIVGDGKQSIYAFRGADVTVFRRKQAEIERAGTHYILTESYRAHRELIFLLNETLRPVLGDTSAATPWREPFAPLAFVREDAQGCESPFMEIHLTAGSKADGALDRAADIIAYRIQSIIEDANGALSYDDVAILCRASTSFAPYEDALDRAGIPYNTVSGRGFYDRPEIRDLLNALKALADPTDNLALAGFLRSPACRLSDFALYLLLESSRENNASSLWAFLCSVDNADIKGIGLEDEFYKIRKARELIQELHSSIGRIVTADLLKLFLDSTNYRAALMLGGSSRSVHNVNKLLSDAHKSGRVGISAFLEYVKALSDIGSREGEASIISEGAVHIMTVHAAKGLEFGIVVIGDAGRRELTRDGLLIDDVFGVVPFLTDPDKVTQTRVLPAAYEIAKEQEKEKALAESDRLLYVAATRVKEKLLLSGVIRINKQGKLSLQGWLERISGEQGLDLTGSPIPYDSEGTVIHQVTTYVKSNQGQMFPVGCAIYEPGFMPCFISSAPVTNSLQLNQPPPYPLLKPIKAEAISVDETTFMAERDPPRSVWRVVPADKRPRVAGWVIGNLVHKALARWFFPDDAGFYDWAEALTQGYGITDMKAIHYAIRTATAILRRFTSYSLFGDMSSAEYRIAEVPYTRINESGQVEYGTIDALYKPKRDSVWHIVEFKTDYIRNEESLRLLLIEKDYINQIERYLQAVDAILGQRPQANLCFLNYSGKVLSITDRW